MSGSRCGSLGLHLIIRLFLEVSEFFFYQLLLLSQRKNEEGGGLSDYQLFIVLFFTSVLLSDSDVKTGGESSKVLGRSHFASHAWIFP